MTRTIDRLLALLDDLEGYSATEREVLRRRIEASPTESELKAAHQALYGTEGSTDPLTADRGQSDDGAEPCGSRRVLETTVVWCGRTDGPCPYPGTPESRGGADRKCADSPGRRLSVVYADDVLLATRRALRQTIGDDAPPFPGVSQDVIHVALAALDACIGDDDGHIAGGEDPGR